MPDLAIQKKETALVVIDLQNGIVGRETAPYTAEKVVQNAVSLANACRAVEMPVFLVRVAMSADGKDSLNPIADLIRPMPTSALPSDWSEIVSELGPKPSDFVITKHQWGAFYGTELDLQLRRRGISTIILCGISTNIGVESTARFAFEYGYSQIFAEDAMTSMAATEHNATVKGILPRIGLVRTTEAIIASL